MPRHPDLLHRDTTALMVVDVQERLHPAMADDRHLPRIELLADAALRLGLPVILTEQYPKGLGPTHPAVAAAVRVQPLVKETFSCLEDPGIRAALESSARSQVVVVGLEAHVCISQTALDLVAAGLTVHVPHDAVNSRRPRDRDWALERLQRGGVTVTSTESALFELLHRAGTEEFRVVSRMLKEIPVE